MKVLAALVLACGTASAAPGQVVLADPDPELRHAIEGTLQPWHIAVIVEPTPTTIDDARGRVEARFVVWRELGELVVLDRDSGTAERRPSRVGSLDAVDAAAAALSVKTLLRLPPLDAPATPAESIGIRGQVGGAMRLAHGSETDASARALISVAIAPWRRPIRLGIAADLGTSTRIDNASFVGTASDWAVVAFASYAIDLGAWAIEPAIGAGIERASLVGTEQDVAREEHVTLAALRGGATVWRRVDRFTFGAELAATVIPGTPTYIKTTGMAEIFAPASFAITLGIVIAAEFR